MTAGEVVMHDEVAITDPPSESAVTSMRNLAQELLPSSAQLSAHAPSPLPRRAPLSTLRRFARREPAVEHCDLCGLALEAEHDHLLEPTTRRLLCSCRACAILFDDPAAKYRRIPRRIEVLADFKISDAQWERLYLPINLAFFYRSSPAQRVVAMFPGPAGATESLLTLDAWRDLEAANPVLTQLEPDVEALLVNRVGTTREYCRVPIDECFKLVGLIRTHWQGLSGGAVVWGEIAGFFGGLKQRSASRGGPHA
jgi:hypothetical protein